MKRLLFRLLEKVSPAAATLARDAYIGLRGARILALLEELRRIQVHLESQLALEESLTRIATGSSRSGGLAVISAMPPMATGIAYSTRATYRYAEYPVDIYAPYDSFADYADSVDDPYLAGSNVRVFDLQALARGRERNHYAAEIYVLGDSRLHWRVYQSLRRAALSPLTGMICAHIHDPCLLNILALASTSQAGLSGTIEANYGDQVRGLDLRRAARDPSKLIERGIMGGRALLKGIPIDRIIVNSAATADLLLLDNPSLCSERLVRSFLPVPACKAGPGPDRTGLPLIGMFALPSMPRRTELVIEAVCLLREHIPDASLLLASYGAGAYARISGARPPPFVRMVDCQSYDALSDLMRSVDVAVHLPDGSFGESQSVVAQLLSGGSPVIVTGPGCLPEYGDAVRAVTPDVTPRHLAEILREELAFPDKRRPSVKRYAAAHGPAEFCRRLIETLRAPSEGVVGPGVLATLLPGTTHASLPRDTRVSTKQVLPYSLDVRISGSLGLLRDAYLSLRGARVLELQEELSALRSLLATSRAGEAALKDSLARLATSSSHSGGVAVISVMPPMETGIANFTRCSFHPARYPVDIYSPYESFPDYVNSVNDPYLTDSNVQVYDIRALARGRVKNKYSAEIYVLGNSDHNLPIYYALQRTAAFPPTAEVWVHVHDPGLYNILGLVSKSRGGLQAAICSSYPDLATGLDLKKAGADFALLAERGIMGARALLRGIPIDRILANSKAAVDLLLRDDPALCREQVLQLFHPVFPVPSGPKPERVKPSWIGTFGVPSLAKRTEVVIEAVRELRRRVPDAMLLIAGYDAGRYGFTTGAQSLPFVRLVDSPSDHVLLDLMRSVDIAVQLRLDNLGESSGVVPQLLANGVPVLASAIGSFREYGNAVRGVSPNITAAELGEVLFEELAWREGRQEKMQQYVATHGPEEFCRRILEALRPCD